MTIAYWCVLLAALLPYAFAGLAKSQRDFDNSHPRQWLSERSGWRQRAHAAQQNSFEAFPPFAAAVLIAHQTGVTQGAIDALAIAFVLLRILYGACYVGNRPTTRSLVWTAGFLCVVGLFVLAGLTGE